MLGQCCVDRYFKQDKMCVAALYLATKTVAKTYWEIFSPLCFRERALKETYYFEKPMETVKSRGKVKMEMETESNKSPRTNISHVIKTWVCRVSQNTYMACQKMSSKLWFGAFQRHMKTTTAINKQVCRMLAGKNNVVPTWNHPASFTYSFTVRTNQTD